MTLSYEYHYEHSFALITYNGYPFYRQVEAFLEQNGASEDEVIDKLIEAFKTVADDTIFGPTQHLIDENDRLPSLLAVLSILCPLPEVLGSATEGYVYQPHDRRAGKRHNKGMNDYILSGFDNEERRNWTTLHWKNVRNGLSHSITANYIWLEDKGDLHQTIRDECGNVYAHLDVVRWQNLFKKGFDRFISKVEDRQNTELRRNFRMYITQREAV